MLVMTIVVSEYARVSRSACQRAGGDSSVAGGAVSASDERPAGSAQRTVHIDSLITLVSPTRWYPRQGGSSARVVSPPSS